MTLMEGYVMYKPLFFTAVMSVVACFAQGSAIAEPRTTRAQAEKPCPDSKVWSPWQKKCIRQDTRGSH